MLANLLTRCREARLDPQLPIVVVHVEESEDAAESSISPIFGPVSDRLAAWLKTLDKGGFETLQDVFGVRETDTGPLQLEVSSEAISIMKTWLIEGPEAASFAISQIVVDPKPATRAVAGLVTIAGVALTQVEAVVGLSGLEGLNALT